MEEGECQSSSDEGSTDEEYIEDDDEEEDIDRVLPETLEKLGTFVNIANYYKQYILLCMK